MTSQPAPDLAQLARVFADRSRAAMCLALLDGRAWTAGELAKHASIARSTASEHLHLLVAAGVFAEEYQGRHRYLRLANDDVAELIESLAAQAPPPATCPIRLGSISRNTALARARTCYDHLAGSLGVAITDALQDRDFLSRGSGWAFTPAGVDWLRSVGVDVDSAREQRRQLTRACLDWTERRSHLAGSFGAALCQHYFRAGWIERIGSGRAVRLTDKGQQALHAALELDWQPDNK